MNEEQSGELLNILRDIKNILKSKSEKSNVCLRNELNTILKAHIPDKWERSHTEKGTLQRNEGARVRHEAIKNIMRALEVDL